jgi:hypothetical protein
MKRMMRRMILMIMMMVVVFCHEPLLPVESTHAITYQIPKMIRLNTLLIAIITST